MLPGLLSHCADGQRTVTIEATTLEECLDNLLTHYPLLKPHLFEETGDLRRHVNIFYDGDNIKWMDDWTGYLKEDSTLTIIQAVAGG